MTVTVWPSLYRPAEGRRVSLAALLARVATPREYATKDDVPRWASGTFRQNYRRLADVEHVHLLAFDFDEGCALSDVATIFAASRGFGHTTWSSTPELPRSRLALVLSRPVNVEEFDRVWRAGADFAERHGLAPDYSARDASRCWALPAARPHYQHSMLNGEAFDVEDALARFPAPPPPEEPERRWEPRDDLAHRIDRASKYLATMPPAISGSGGHAATFKAAVVLVRGFALPEDEALRMLTEEYNPRCSPPWSAWELKHKIRSAAQRGRLEPGWLADRQRDGRAA